MMFFSLDLYRQFYYMHLVLKIPSDSSGSVVIRANNIDLNGQDLRLT